MQNAYKKSGPCADCYLCENRVLYAFEGKQNKTKPHHACSARNSVFLPIYPWKELSQRNVMKHNF